MKNVVGLPPELDHGPCRQATVSYCLFRHLLLVVVRLAWKKVLGRKGFSSYTGPYCLAVLLRLVSIYRETYGPFMGTHSASRGHV